MCLNEHNKHNIILFSNIGLSQNEIKQFDNIMKEIEININKIIDITNEINKFINNIKLINDNCSIYENDNNNNYKYYSIKCLNLINDKLKLKEKITLPKIEKEDIKRNDDINKKEIQKEDIKRNDDINKKENKKEDIKRKDDKNEKEVKRNIENIKKEDIGKWELR